MADLVPQDIDPLLRRMAHELAHGACFDLPARAFHRAPEGLDLGVFFHGERAGNALGPAAGPQSQLAQNLVLGYLGGGRIFELKTVQVLDTLELPRPCIDAANVGFNVEWSQELRLSQSRAEYVKAWVLLHTLRGAGLGLGLEGAGGDFLFDLSVGYDLEGVKSGKVRAFLDGMLDARAEIDALFDAWPRDLIAWRPERAGVPDRVSSNVTLSTFHGCPAEEIERICEHLLTGVGTHVVVKLNPTLMDFDELSSLLNDRLGYQELRPHRASFEHELRLGEAAALVRRLSGVARAHGRTLGVKFTNTLVVENNRTVFAPSQKQMYLSGAPLHVVALELARRFRDELGEAVPVSFSGGVDARNFAACVAAGLSPVTTCTDLLRPGGYSRLPRYLEQLASRMRGLGVASVPDFILAESGRSERAALVPAAALPALLEQASRQNHAAAARKALEDPRYRAAQNRAVPRRVGTRLWLFDCLSCDKCVPVCPNDANFTIEAPGELQGEVRLPDLVARGGTLVEERERVFVLKDRHQLATYADFCNDCGNCDTFCPEDGGPYLVKPRFFGDLSGLERAKGDGFVLQRGERVDRIEGRHRGQRVSLELDRARTLARYDDGAAVVELGFPGFERLAATLKPGVPEGHTVRLDLARALAVLLCGAFAEGASSPPVARFLPAVGPPGR
ncbi:MAG: hypothetical protein ACYC8T_05420 [Myxococcaceae bacterium]